MIPVRNVVVESKEEHEAEEEAKTAEEVPQGRQLEVGAQRAPRLLLFISITHAWHR